MILCVSVLAASCSWLDNPSPKGQIPANKLTDNDLALLTNGYSPSVRSIFDQFVV